MHALLWTRSISDATWHVMSGSGSVNQRSMVCLRAAKSDTGKALYDPGYYYLGKIHEHVENGLIMCKTHLANKETISAEELHKTQSKAFNHII